MIKHKSILLGAVLFSTKIFAFPCFFTLVKDSCWTDYDVTVTVHDVINEQTILTVTVPKGKSWVREAFTCQPNQKLKYTAIFSPAIWENSEGKVYNAQHYWALPETITAAQKAWDIPVCYPEAFAEVPFPPKASGNCKCDLNSIPPIPPVASSPK